MTPSDTTIDYKASLFLYLHNDKTKNWLLLNIGMSNMLRNNGGDDREWIWHEEDQSQSASSSKSNIRFVGSPTVLHWEGNNFFIWSEFEVHEHLMESLFHKLSNGSNLTSRSHWQGLQTSRQAVISTKSCIVIVGLIFTLGTLAQVGARPKEM
jgi:hypothetical protein